MSCLDNPCDEYEMCNLNRDPPECVPLNAPSHRKQDIRVRMPEQYIVGQPSLLNTYLARRFVSLFGGPCTIGSEGVLESKTIPMMEDNLISIIDLETGEVLCVLRDELARYWKRHRYRGRLILSDSQPSRHTHRYVNLPYWPDKFIQKTNIDGLLRYDHTTLGIIPTQFIVEIREQQYQEYYILPIGYSRGRHPRYSKPTIPDEERLIPDLENVVYQYLGPEMLVIPIPPEIYHITFNEDGTRLAGGGHNRLIILELEQGESISVEPAGEIHSLAFSRDILAFTIEEITVLDVSTMEATELKSALRSTLSIFDDILYYIKESVPVSRHRPFGNARQVLGRYDLETRESLEPIELPVMAPVAKILPNPQQTKLLLVGNGGSDPVWLDLETLEVNMWPFSIDQENFIYKASFQPNSHNIAIKENYSSTIQIVSLEFDSPGEIIKTLAPEGEDNYFHHFQFNADGSRLAIGLSDRDICVYETENWTLKQILRAGELGDTGTSDFLRTLDFSPVDPEILSACYLHTITILKVN